ncbi:MAG: phosphate ABC transporter substrate-binding protein [Acidobacteria bacterium]|nr:phosphate ABC transporter substrate-binding protein [Acidobacteriota bacterium]
MKKLGYGFSLIFLLAIWGCGGSGGSGTIARSITIKGSDTMVILGQRWAETYMKIHPDKRIQVTGGGSGTGIAALINGGTDICEASRPMKEKEKEMVRKRHGKDVTEIPVALDGVAVYVPQSSRIKTLTQAQLKSIYTGTITNWRDVGGDDRRIVAYSRENNSGTYVFFKEHVLNNEDFARDIQTLPGTAAVVNAVSKDPASLGYGGIAYASGIKAIAIKQDEESDGVIPSLETVESGQYPLSRQLFFYTVGPPSEEIKIFIDWVLSSEGQKICEAVGYYPLVRK